MKIGNMKNFDQINICHMYIDTTAITSELSVLQVPVLLDVKRISVLTACCVTENLL